VPTILLGDNEEPIPGRRNKEVMQNTTQLLDQCEIEVAAYYDRFN
jgi:hypothetical protein